MDTKNEIFGLAAGDVAAEAPPRRCQMKLAVFAALAVWLGVDAFLGLQGAFVGGPEAPPWRLLLGLAIPLALFFAGYSGWKEFRGFILGADIRLVGAIEGWRWAGLGFLSLYAHGILPGLFAFPAGLGDMAVGLTAPWIVLGLVRDPSLAGSRRFVLWNVFGILDLVVAVSLGALCSGFFHGINGLIGGVTTRAVTQLPLVFIPTYLVPFFLMLHATALFQARQRARAGR